jgi:hypothetical protein
VEECGPCPVFASFTLASALQLRKKHRKTSVRVRKTSIRVQYTYYQNTHTLQYLNIHKHTHTHITKQYKTTTVQIKTNTVTLAIRYKILGTTYKPDYNLCHHAHADICGKVHKPGCPWHKERNLISSSLVAVTIRSILLRVSD